MRLIDADALIVLIKKRLKNTAIIGWLCSIIAEAPTIEAEPVRHGEWVTDEYDSGEPEAYPAFLDVHCSECGYDIGAESGQFGWCYGDPFPMSYCPNCGAKMDGDSHAD